MLVDSAERPEEIDAARAKREADQAREAMLQKKSRQEYQLSSFTLFTLFVGNEHGQQMPECQHKEKYPRHDNDL